MPAGQPTKYKRKYCKMLIEHMCKGYSFESFAADLDTCKQTLYTWLEVHPEFLDAKKLATAKSMKWWEGQGVKGLWTEEGGAKLNTGVYVFNMKNRFGWADQTRTATEILITRAQKDASSSKEDD